MACPGTRAGKGTGKLWRPTVGTVEGE